MHNLYEELNNYAQSDYYPFHMPGHKRNMSQYPMSSIYQKDITEIEGFDNLHHSEGLLLEVQEKAAKLYGADETYYLINGSSCGILSAVSACVNRQGTILMARNCHKAAYNAVFLRELAVEYLFPANLDEYGIYGEVNPDEIAAALEKNSEIEAVLITSPTFDGIVSDVKKIADIVHTYEKILIVDEAHGAHFGLADFLPASSVVSGADIVIHSVHKTLPAFTQSALLHVMGNRINKDKLRYFLSVYQSTSPSYLLMAGIDQCINIIMHDGSKLFELMKSNLTAFYEVADSFQRIKSIQIPGADPGKLIISVKNTNLSGNQLYSLLLDKYHIQMEMAADSYVLAIVTCMDTTEGIMRLAGVLKEIDCSLGNQEIKDKKFNNKKMPLKSMLFRPLIIFTISQAFEKEENLIPFTESIGKVSKEFIYVYPPGIPILVPGEEITMEIIELVSYYQSLGLPVQGTKDVSIETIEVIQ